MVVDLSVASGFFDLTSADGELVGKLVLPPNLTNQANATLDIVAVTNLPSTFSGQQLGGTLLDITLSDLSGNQISQLDQSLTICLAPVNKSKSADRPCLSYFDEKEDKWLCQDRCLTSPSKGDLVCGRTDHLTNFAMLLSGKGSNDPCSPPSATSNVLSWVSLAMVCVAIVIVALGAVVAEIRIRYKNFKINVQLTRSQRLAAI